MSVDPKSLADEQDASLESPPPLSKPQVNPRNGGNTAMTPQTSSVTVKEARSRLAAKRSTESEGRKLRHELAGRLLQDPGGENTLALVWELVDQTPRNKPFWAAVNVAREMMRDCTDESAYRFMKETLAQVFGEDIVRVASRCRSLYFRWESPWRQLGSTHTHAVNA